MNINKINGISHRGWLVVNNSDNKKKYIKTEDVDTISSNGVETTIMYKAIHTNRGNGYQELSYPRIKLKTDLNTVLSAYNATKNTKLTVDLRQ